MVFRRFHRTAGPPLLLALVGIMVAILLPILQRSQEPALLPFLGFTNYAGAECALFILPERRSMIFNLTTLERRHVTLISETSQGPVTDQAAQVHDTTLNGSPALAVPIPTHASSIRVIFQQNVRRGRVRIPRNGPPVNLFQLPWSRTELFWSETIALTNAMGSKESK